MGRLKEESAVPKQNPFPPGTQEVELSKRQSQMVSREYLTWGKLSIWTQWSQKETSCQLPRDGWENKALRRPPPIPFCLPASPAGHRALEGKDQGAHTGCNVSLASTQAGGGASKVVVHLYYHIHLLNKHSASTYYVPTTLLTAGWWRGLDIVRTFKAVRILAGEGNVNKRLQAMG